MKVYNPADMNAEFEVARATRADVAAIAPLFDTYRQFYQRAADLESAYRFLSDRIANDESVVFFCHPANDRAKPIGFTQLYRLFSSLSMAPSWVLNDLFVAPEFRHHGVARLLLSAADEHAQKTGAIGIALETNRNNLAAQALYESFGYEQVDDAKHYWRSIHLGAVLLSQRPPNRHAG